MRTPQRTKMPLVVAGTFDQHNMGVLLRAVAAVAATAAAVAAGSPSVVISVSSKTISTTNSRYASWTVDASWNLARCRLIPLQIVCCSWLFLQPPPNLATNKRVHARRLVVRRVGGCPQWLARRASLKESVIAHHTPSSLAPVACPPQPPHGRPPTNAMGVVVLRCPHVRCHCRHSSIGLFSPPTKTCCRKRHPKGMLEGEQGGAFGYSR